MTPDGTRVRIPADIEREDRILANLTARQLAILSVAVVLAYGLYTLSARLAPPAVAAMLTVPLLGSGAAIALVRRDGLGLDRLLLAAWRHSCTPRQQVYAPEGIEPAPEQAGPVPAPLWLPVRCVRSDGVLDLGSDGVAALVECTTVSFALRTAEEQRALVTSFGRWLNSLSHPVQVLIAAEQINLRPTIERLRDDAPALPHPALERAALDHAAFLAKLGASRDLLRRRVLLILREPHGGGPRTTHDPAGAAGRVLRRAEDACRALGAAAVSARVLDATQATAALATCLDPDIPPGLIDQALPGEAITAKEYQ
jgi:hypothetical protein